MEPMSHPHWETLTPATLQAFHQVERPPFIAGFYLAGVTGLSLHLGYRFSVDLDFFSPDESDVGPDQRDALRILLNDPSLAITSDKDGTMSLPGKGLASAFSDCRFTRWCRRLCCWMVFHWQRFPRLAP